VPVAPTPILAEPTDQHEFTERMVEGIRLETAGDYVAAAKAFDRAIELRNGDPDAWRERGRVEMLRNAPTAALMYLQVATGLDPLNPQARGWRGEVHHTLGEHQEAIEQYSYALQIERASVARSALLVGKGDALLALGRSEQALQDYDEAMRVWPGSVTGSLRRANLLLLLDRPQDAIEEASRALAVGGERAEAYLLRGTAYTRLEQHQPAQADLGSALRLAPERSDIAALLEAAKSLSEAKVVVVAQVDPPPAPQSPPPPVQAPSQQQPPARTAHALWVSARLHIEAGNFSEAIEELDEAIRQKPGYARAYNTRGYAWLRQKNYARAVADCERALTIEPGYANAAVNRDVAMRALRGSLARSATGAEAGWRAALDLINSHQYAPAIRILDETLERSPTYARAYNARGFAWLLQRDYAKAIADFDRALQLEPNYRNAAHNRSRALQVAKGKL
jgi:tetratricopeptide (TPR) repeat protein